MVVPYLGEDIMYNIFTKVDARQLQDQLKYGCKQWHKLITSSCFIDDHLHQTKPIWIAIPYFDWRDTAEERKMFVIGVCNGLLLLEDNVEHRLSVSNPVLNQLQPLPLTVQDCGKFVKAVLHGITFVDSTREYKVACFVINHDGSIGCKLLTLGSSSTKWISSSLDTLGKTIQVLHNSIISIKGVFHFIIESVTFCPISSSVKIISFDAKDEKFYISKIPVARMYIRREVLHDIHGYPSVVVPNLCAQQRYEQFWHWDVWVLVDLYSGECDRRYSVNLTAYGDYLSRSGSGFHDPNNSVVLLTLENGKFFLLRQMGEHGYEHYVYDVTLQELKCLELNPQVQYVFKPYVETLVLCSKP
ncbi:hypothetical protein FRX31_012997 [Thalictrum thalictroides]|uniref:F-box associated beta-propeller type 3 domain-containing protein n=1 Tax=Thalictrum thalictroides TaxID=46969 RepID=A0A7J6WKH9_THATH|nr:hypothetical protein FRX31_012997 [Thalictrum thalictroides]